MKKPVKVLWGMATLMPVTLTVLGAVSFFVFFISKFPEFSKNQPPPPDFPKEMFAGMFLSYGLFLSGIVMGFFIVISYFIHMVRTERLNKDQRTMWSVLFVIFRSLAMVVYWFIHVWPDEEGSSSDGVTRTGESLRRVRKKRE